MIESLSRFLSTGHYSPVFVMAAWIVLALAVVVFGFSAMLIIHHSVSDRRRRRRSRALRGAAADLGPSLVVVDEIGPRAREVGAEWGEGAVASVLRLARTEIVGELADEISRVLEDLGEVDRLIDAADDRKPWKRAAAILALGECGGARAREVLVGATADEAPDVRRAARDGLLMERHPEAIEAAVQSYLDDVPLRTAWRRSFYARLAGVAPAELRRLVVDGSLDINEEKLAMEALGEARAAQTLPLAAQRIVDEDAELRATAARVLGKLGDQQGLSLLIGRLADDEWFVRAAAARSLGSLDCGAPECASLATLLTDQAWWVRANAATTLSRQGDLGVQHLLDVLEGGDRFARHSALTALAFTDLHEASQARLDHILGELPADGLDMTAVNFLRANLAMERL